MKRVEIKAYQAALVKAVVVKFFMQKAARALAKLSSEEKKKSEKFFKEIVEKAVNEIGIDNLVSPNDLSKREFGDHVQSIIERVGKRVEKELTTLADKQI